MKAKTIKTVTKANFDEAERTLHALADGMAAVYSASAYDALLQAAARIKPKLSPNYRPGELYGYEAEKSATFAHLILETVPVPSPMYMALANIAPVPFEFSGHPDAVAKRLYHAAFAREVQGDYSKLGPEAKAEFDRALQRTKPNLWRVAADAWRAEHPEAEA